VNCPRCRLLNSPTAERCDCGYDFASRLMKEPYVRPNSGNLSHDSPSRAARFALWIPSLMRATKGWTATILLAMLAVALVALRLHYGAIALALVSAGLAVVWAQLRWASARWSLAVVAPVAVAYAFYGLHFWMLTVTSVRRRGGIESSKYARRIAGRWIDSARRKNWVTHANHLVT
jgi:hypothetical protein